MAWEEPSKSDSVSVKDKADDLKAKIDAGENFASLANIYTDDPSNYVNPDSGKGGDLGFVMKGQTLPEIANAMVKLKAGETSEVIESSIGFHIVQLNNKENSRVIALDEVKPEILNHLLKFETEKLLQSYLSKLRKRADIKIYLNTI